MGLLDAPSAVRQARDPREEAARELEALVFKQVLTASGAFKGSGAAGAAMWTDLLAEAVASSVTRQGGFGVAAALAHASGAPAPEPAVPAVVGATSHLTSAFGPRVDPLGGGARFHAGVNLAAPEGAPILCANDGVVVRAGPRGDYGNAVEVQHADGTSTLYAHAATVSVHEGQSVHAGQPIATIGSTGKSTGPHLHFELRRSGRPVDPLAALQKYGRRAEEAGDAAPGWVP